MNAIFEKDMSGIEHLMSNETICWGEVARLARDTDGQSYMVTTLPMMQQHKVSGGERCVIYASEADADNVNPHLMNLMGRQVPFIVTAVDEENNRLLCSRKKAQTTLKAAMLYYGGIAAEELIFGRSEVTTGASQDIKEASFWIREYLRYESVHGLLDEESFTGRPYSESSLEEAQKLSKELFDMSKQFLLERCELLQSVAQTLIRKDTILEDGFDQLIAQVNHTTTPAAG